MNRDQALSALDMIGDAQSELARAAECPLWRHVAFGALMGAVVLSQGVTTPANFVLLGLAGAAGVLIYESDRRRMGMFINGYRKGATRPLTFLLLGVMLVIGVAEYQARANGLTLATRIGIALVAAIIATGMSIAWQRTFRREMGLGK